MRSAQYEHFTCLTSTTCQLMYFCLTHYIFHILLKDRQERQDRQDRQNRQDRQEKTKSIPRRELRWIRIKSSKEGRWIDI